jgi:F0F1-type ATP synthase assembly protein I
VVEPAADNVRERRSRGVREHQSEAVRERRFASVSGRKPLADHQALYNGFGNALAQAVEFVATPVIFFLTGRWIDHRLGIGPVFEITLFVLALVGVSVSAYYRYKAAIDEAEKGKPWKR